MADITAETQTLIDAGGFENEGDNLLFLRRIFDDRDHVLSGGDRR